MNIKIKIVLTSSAIAIVIISLLLIWTALALSKESQKLKEIDHSRNLMFDKTEELKDSSDDLTKYARLYAHTANEKYKNIYFRIIDIRNGEARKPVNYGSIYWTIPEPIRSQRHPLGQASSLRGEIEKLPFLPFEVAKLKESESNSNGLVKLEVEAFNAVEGLFKDDAGNYSIKGKPDQQKAVELLTSEEYHQVKETIMLPIDDVLSSLINRTREAALAQNKLVHLVFQRILVVVFFGSLILLFAAFFIKKRLLLPIEYLTNSIATFKKGEEVVVQDIQSNDEMGILTKRFFEMKDDLDAELLKSKELATIDPLTGIKNRRYFYDIGESILKIARRSSKPLSILMLDIDHFKAINDNYGHIIGDDVLVYFARVVRMQLRESDILARYGGEEFVILLPNTNIEGAAELSEKIRLYIEDNPYADSKLSIPITISIGATEAEQDKQMRRLTQRADEALYEAKETGRNRVVIK